MVNYGFGLYTCKSADKRAEWDQKYWDLSEEDKNYYDNCLPMILLSTGITFVSEKTIPEIVLRECAYSVAEFSSVECMEPEALAKHLIKYIGYETDIIFEPTSKWARRVFSHSKFKGKDSIIRESDRVRRAGYYTI